MKKNVEKEIVSLVQKMENNTFLLPDSWSSDVAMSNFDWSYKTYVGGRGCLRYINVNIITMLCTIEISIRSNSVFIQKPMSLKLSPENVLEYVQEIYNEKHSFKEYSEGKKSIRLKIKNLQHIIKESNDKIIKLKKELEDSELITN